MAKLLHSRMKPNPRCRQSRGQAWGPSGNWPVLRAGIPAGLTRRRTCGSYLQSRPSVPESAPRRPIPSRPMTTGSVWNQHAKPSRRGPPAPFPTQTRSLSSRSEGPCGGQDRRAGLIQGTFAQQPCRGNVIQLGIHALEPRLNHRARVLLSQKCRNMIGGSQPGHRIVRGIALTISPLPHGTGFLHRSRKGDELCAQNVPGIANELRHGEPNRIPVRLKSPARSCN